MNLKRKSQLQLAGFAVILVAFGAVASYFVFSFGGDEGQESADTATTPTGVSADSPDEDEETIPYINFPEGFIPEPINGYYWELQDGFMLVPSHPEHGPKQLEPFATGFAQTPEGAALTASYTASELFGASIEDFDLFTEKHVTGPGVEGAKEINALSNDLEPAVRQKRRSAIAGWDIDSYESDRAVVSLYIMENGSSTVDRFGGVEVYFIDGVWKVYVNEEGGFVLEENIGPAEKEPQVKLSKESLIL